jgi:hypothetical protein
MEGTELNVETLNRGDDITPEECERILGIDRDHEHFPLKLATLASQIIRESGRSSRRLSACCRQGGIHINTDFEASVYHAKLARTSERGLLRHTTLMRTTVRVSQLTATQRRQHDEALCRMATKVAALRRAARDT